MGVSQATLSVMLAFVLLSMGGALPVGAASPSDPLYEVTTIGVGMFPYSVAVNPLTNAIYVTNGGEGTISVIDGATNVVGATITVGSSPTGLAVNPQTNFIYVANTGPDTVSVIDGATNTVVS